MGFHTFDPEKRTRLEDPERFRFCSREELLAYLPRETDARLLDIGSGVGFYTDELAPYFETIVAFDLQEVMHEQYQSRGVPATVELVTGEASVLPFADASLDGAFSTMTFHESTTPAAVNELARVLVPGGVFVAVDWSGAGDGVDGPPLEERYDVEEACEVLEAGGFEIERARERAETFSLVARRPGESHNDFT